MFLRKALDIVAVALLASCVLRAQVSDDEIDHRAATALGVPVDSIQVLTVGQRRTPGGVKYDAVKVMMKSTSETIGIYIGADGSLADESFFEPPPGTTTLYDRKVSPLLVDLFARKGNGAQPIVVWLSVEPAQIDFRADMDSDIEAGKSVDEARATMRERLAASNAATVTAGAVSLQSLGFPVLSTDIYAPVVFTTADAFHVAQLAELPFVDQIFPSLTYEPELIDQVATHRFDRVHEFGVNGKGVKVAIVEDDAVNNSHPDLNVVARYHPNNNIDFHATACAGIIGSRDTTYPGHARGVEIYSGNAQTYADSNITGATSWAIAQGVDIVNMSFGVDTNGALAFLDRYVDYQVRYTATSIIKSAGNRGLTDGDITSPGLGWNVLAVGNFSSNENSDWDDDAMNSSSSFVDPVSTFNDREKPDIAAVGTSIVTTDVNNGFSNQGSGTSYSAPAVAGMAACFMQMQSGLRSSPELVRAVMMAGATHNVEGVSRLSEKDGAGGINGLQAYRIVQQRHFSFGSFTPSSFSNNGFYTQTIQLQAGDRARICLAWSSDGLYLSAFPSLTTDTLRADLDLAVLVGSGVTSGTALALSSSYDNSFEIIEFVPPVTGSYTIRINDFRFDGSSEQFGLAWTQHADGRYVRFRESQPDVTATDLVGPCIGNQFAGFFPYDRVNPGDAVYCLASAGIGVGVSLPDGRHSYGDLDALASFSIDPNQNVFNGFFGFYDTSANLLATPGLYTGYHLNLPDVPSLVGYPMYFTAITIEGGHPSSIKEISEIKKIEIQSHAQNLALGDDSSIPALLPFSFPFYGQNYSICFVNSNGNVTFGGGDVDFSETIAELLSGLPRICAFWDDMNPAAGGLVRVRQSATEFIIEWVNVPQFNAPSGDAQSAMMTLHSNGRIEIEYRDCTTLDSIVGISPGGGSGGNQVDITTGYQFGGYGGALYEHFTGVGTGEEFDLDSGSSGILGSLFFTERKLVSFTPQSNFLFGTRYIVEIDH